MYRRGAGLRPADRGVALVIEDYPAMLVTCRRILESAGFRTLGAETGAEGVQLLRFHRDEVKVVLLDWMLPDMYGDVWLDEILRIKPDAKVIFYSGHYLSDELLDSLEGKVVAFLRKPFSAEQLLYAVETAEATAAAPGAEGQADADSRPLA